MPSFDPYHKWLTIPPEEQPPHHYRLLGLTLFESDPDVIDTGAEQRTTYLRACATGAYVADSQRLLNEVMQARLCLLDPRKKAAYDAELRRRLAPAAPAAPPESDDPLAGIDSFEQVERPRRTPRQGTAARPATKKTASDRDRRRLVTAGTVAGVSVVAIAVAVPFAFRGAQPDPRRPSAENAATAPQGTASTPDPIRSATPGRTAATGGGSVRPVATSPSDGSVIDLVPFVDPKQDTIRGDWTVDGGRLSCSTMHLVPRIEFAYVPPEEYDFEMEFEQQRPRNAVGLIVPNGGHSSVCEFGGPRRRCWFSTGSQESRFTTPDGSVLLQAGFRHVAVLEVRRDRRRVLLDGRELLVVDEGLGSLHVTNWHRIRHPEVLAVSCDDPTVFHSVRLREVTGHGKRTRE